MSHELILKLDPVLHAPNRLAIMSVLITAESAKFTFLRESIGVTDGNLNTHLTKLENCRYIKIKKSFAGKKPQTICSITKTGRNAFEKYFEQLERIINSQKSRL